MPDETKTQATDQPTPPAPTRDRRKMCEQLFASLGAAPAAGGMLAEREQEELVALCYEDGVLRAGARDLFRRWWTDRRARMVEHANAANMKKRLRQRGSDEDKETRRQGDTEQGSRATIDAATVAATTVPPVGA